LPPVANTAYMVNRSGLEEPYKRARILAVLWGWVNLCKR
jgi:hypothetical protein